MPFLAPMMLLGGIAVGIPVIIHLLNRRRIKIVRWAAMEFLKDILKKSSRILQIKDLILLVMRTLALLFLVLAVSRVACVSTGAWSTGADVGNALFVFDTSYSMAYTIGNESIFDRAKKAAVRILKTYGPGSRVQILTVDERMKRLFDEPTDDLVLADKAIQEDITAGAGGGNMRLLLDAAAQELKSLDVGRRDIYIFTDMQASTWRFDPGTAEYEETLEKLGQASGVYVINCSFENVQNVAIASLELADGVAVAEIPTEFTAKVINTGKDARKDVQLGMRVYGLGSGAEGAADPDAGTPFEEDGDEVGERSFVNTSMRVGDVKELPTIPVGGHGVSVDPEPYLFPRPGSYLVEVFIVGGDNLEVDDRRFLDVQVRQNIKVLCVEGKNLERETAEKVGDTFYLRRVLAPYMKSEPEKKFPYRSVRMTVEQLYQYDWLQPTGAEEAEAGTSGEFAGTAPDDLSQYALVALANVKDLKYEFVAALEKFVGHGGALMIFLGENSDGRDVTYSDLLYRSGLGLLPARLVTDFGVPFERYKEARDLFALDTSRGQLRDAIFQTGNDELTRRATFSRPLFTKAWQLVLPQDDPELAEPPPPEPVTTPETPTTPPAEAGAEKKEDEAEKPPPGSGVVKGLAEVGTSYQVGAPEVLARFLKDGIPFAVRRKFGKGRVILFNTTCDSTWTTLPYCTALGMYLYAARDLIGARPGEAVHTVGSKLVYDVSRVHAESGFMLTNLRGEAQECEVLPAGKDELGGQRRVIEVEPALTSNPGLYCVHLWDAPESSARRYFAVNVDVSESALDMLEEEAEKPFFSPIKDKVMVAKYPMDIPAVLETKKAVHEYAMAMLVLALCLLVAEPIVAAYMSPRTVTDPRVQAGRYRPGVQV